MVVSEGRRCHARVVELEVRVFGMQGIDREELAAIQRDQFVHYLGMAHALGDVGDWAGLRGRVVDALRAAWALDAVRDDRDAELEEARVRSRVAAAQDLVDQVARHHPPARQWDDFASQLWHGRGRLLDAAQ